jgi:RNA polymerase sigma factor (sigma-70 family)
MQNRPLFNEIIRRYDQYIRLVVAKYFKNAMDRDDVFQEVMILLMEKVDKLDVNHPKANIKGWVGVLTRNKCISILRSQKKFDVIRKNTGTDDYLFSNAVSTLFGDSADTGMVLKSVKSVNIEKMLSKLNERDRKLIVLRFFENHPIKEIDRITGVKNSAVYIKRIIEKLQKMENAKVFFEYFDGFEID